MWIYSLLKLNFQGKGDGVVGCWGGELVFIAHESEGICGMGRECYG